jgi:hypothetical protein
MRPKITFHAAMFRGTLGGINLIMDGQKGINENAG